MHRHKPGALKQSNKSFKNGKHSTKRALTRKNKGKVAVEEATTAIRNNGDDKTKRKMKADQDKRNRRQALVEARRSGTGGMEGPPKIVVGLGLGPTVDVDGGFSKILSKLGVQSPPCRFDKPFSARVTFGKQKQRFTMVNAGRDIVEVLDAVKVADILVCFVSSHSGLAPWSEGILRAVRHQGVPSVLTVVSDLEVNRAKNETRAGRVRMAEKAMEVELHEDSKAVAGDTDEDLGQVARWLFNMKMRPISWREDRCYIAGQEVAYDPASSVMAVSGYIRGRALNINRVIHIPGLGNFQATKVVDPGDPCGRHTGGAGGDGMDVDAAGGSEWAIASADAEQQDSLEEAFPADYMENEQTWPTEEELANAEMNAPPAAQSRGTKGGASSALLKSTIGKKKVPKGWSEYQAEWLVESDEDDEDEDGGEDDDEELGSGEEFSHDEMEEEETRAGGVVMADSDTAGGHDAGDLDEDADMEVEDGLTPEQRAEKRRVAFEDHRRKAEEDLEFADEVDAPMDKKALERFNRYRGLKSFRSSPWDVKESLPRHYAQIFQFENPARSRKRALQDKDGIEVGRYVTIHLAAVNEEQYKKAANRRVVIISALFAHEQRFSVNHFSVKRTNNYEEPIRSKERLVFHFGFRRYEVEPIFSQNNMNCNKNKFERYLQPGRFSVASIIGPIVHTKCPLLMFKESDGPTKALTLVGTGSFLNTNPDRLLIKRIILTGLPFKIHKSKVTVRYMFNSPEDIRWFKPVELWTKHGRRGHIIEPLGTHGYMKCQFDGVVYHHDTVCMSLYKRVFPKWKTQVASR